MPVNPKYERGSNNWEKRGRYEIFLDKFSSVADSNLVESVKFELKNLGKDLRDIPALKEIS